MKPLSRVHRRVASLSRQRGFVRLPMFIARWGSKPFRIQDLFRANEPGVHFETYDPNTILRRRNLLLNSAWAGGTNGVIGAGAVAPTNWVVGLSGSFSISDSPRYPGSNQIRFVAVAERPYVVAAAGNPAVTVGESYIASCYVDALASGSVALDNLFANQGSATATLAFRKNGVVVGGATLAAVGDFLEAVYTITGAGTFQYRVGPGSKASTAATVDITLSPQQLEKGAASSAYQKVTDWNTEFLAAGGDRVTMFQDNTCTTPITAVEQTIGAIISSERGTARGANVVVNGTFDANLANWTNASGAWSWDATGKAKLTGDSTLQELLQVGVLTAGQWYEFSYDVSASGAGIAFQDGAGTALATGTNGTVRGVFRATNTAFGFKRQSGVVVGTVDNVSVRALPGSVATQSTAGAKPKLEARVNLLLKTQEFDDAAWTKTDTTVTANAIAAPDGTLTADLLTEGAATTAVVQQGATLSGAATVVGRIKLKRGNNDWVQVAVTTADRATAGFRAWVNLSTGAVGGGAAIGTGTFTSAATADLGGGWWDVGVTGVVATSTAPSLWTSSASASGSGVRVANSARYQWGADLRTAADAALDIPAYQRVNTATDYDTDGFPHRVRHDKSDDFLSVPLNMSTTDKVTAWISGNLKADDATSQILFELTASTPTTFASFNAAVPVAGTNSLRFSSRGNAVGVSDAGTSANAFPAPLNGVLMAAGDIAADVATLDLNGVQVATSAADQGAGNYANDTLYIGRRGGASLPSSAGWTALTVRGALSDAGTKTKTNRYHARLAKINL